MDEKKLNLFCVALRIGSFPVHLKEAEIIARLYEAVSKNDDLSLKECVKIVVETGEKYKASE